MKGGVKVVLAWPAGSGAVQGLFIGATFAYLTTSAVPKAGQPGNGVLMRAALQKALPVVNVFEEAAWSAARRAGRA